MCLLRVGLGNNLYSPWPEKGTERRMFAAIIQTQHSKAQKGRFIIITNI